MPRDRLSTAALAALLAALSGCGATRNPASSAAPGRPTGHITSSILEGEQLTRPIVWQARVKGVPAARVTAVRFLIDGRLRHTERQAPYVFAGAGNLLLPGALGRGSHTFAVVADTAGGRQLIAATTATVTTRAPAVPPALLGAWTRPVTQADVHRTERFRVLGPGEVALPVGTWRMKIGPDGVARYRDPTATHDVTVGQVRFASDHRLVVGNVIPNVADVSQGGFCPDPVAPGRYRWTLHADTLAVHAVDDRACADRNSFWNGTFTRLETP